MQSRVKASGVKRNGSNPENDRIFLHMYVLRTYIFYVILVKDEIL